MSISLLHLWAPILLGTFLAWIASGVIHMVIKYHNSDYQPLSNEDEVMDAVRNGSPTMGSHNMPYCVDMNEMKNESMQQKYKNGPVAFLTVLPTGMPPMGKLMLQQIGFFLFGSVLIAYCAVLALEPGTDYMVIFRFVATTGFLACGWGVIPFSIWYGHLWSTTAKYLLDALIYGLVVAGSFAWLWPAAA
ncbi:MAG: hypothetical protein HOI35_03020 [Woeseia sp.]|nr:hypothetical protein [Woeseia sp.]MBT6208978.1 hypothetical protein [Woeseia sp.]